MDSKSNDASADRQSLEDLVRAELEDSLDEELELELGDDLLARLPASMADAPQPEGLDRRRYFTELLRLQRELIKLQDWVVDQKLKVVVLFEGRDAAGKGGVIKRVTQRLNPRICRTVALSGADRARAHAVVLPALRRAPAGGRRDRAVRPQLVQPRRRRARHGLLQRGRRRGVLPHRARVRAHAGALRHHPAEVLVLDHRPRAEPALP